MGWSSTVVDARGDVPVLLRPGAVTAETIEAVLGNPLVREKTDVRMRRGSLLATTRPMCWSCLNR